MNPTTSTRRAVTLRRVPGRPGLLHLELGAGAPVTIPAGDAPRVLHALRVARRTGSARVALADRRALHLDRHAEGAFRLSLGSTVRRRLTDPDLDALAVALARFIDAARRRYTAALVSAALADANR